MVAYSFKKRFAGAIQHGSKTQTIRAARKRHAQAGEALQLYCGMRTAHCFSIMDDPVCTEVLHVEMDFERDRIALHTGRDEFGAMSAVYNISSKGGLDAFAYRDGFISWADMKAFWQSEHKEASDGDLYFDGILINWGRPYFEGAL